MFDFLNWIGKSNGVAARRNGGQKYFLGSSGVRGSPECHQCEAQALNMSSELPVMGSVQGSWGKGVFLSENNANRFKK